jgi:hypothetical protein
MPGVRRLCSKLVFLLIAGTWAFVAMAKVIFPSDEGSWIATFPLWLQWSVVLVEAATAAVFFAGQWRIGLWLGLGLLLAFTTVLAIDPPQPGQSCGCLGSVAVSTGARDVASHLFGFASLHILGISLLEYIPGAMKQSGPEVQSSPI